MAGIVGLVAGVIPLVTMANDLYHSIQRLRLNPQRSNHLTMLVARLVEVLGTAHAASSAAENLVSSSLQEVMSTLASLPEARKMRCCPSFVSGFIAAPGEASKLDEVEKKLESLTTQVVVVESIFQLKEESVPRVFNESMELPECTVGLERAKHVLDFLQRSASEQFRIIGIHGQPGVGKTTILNHIWEKASSTAPFAARAHIQIGHNAGSQICNLQSIILQQLGGGRVEFTSLESGKKKLSEHLQQLRCNKRPVLLAIDNVFEIDDLTKLLPFNLSKDILPASSAIVVTCRDFAVVRALLTICHLQEKNEAQVLCFSPPCLNSAESKAVFAACGDLCNDADAELLESLVPLCCGLPLALTVLGKLFAGNAKRSREEWELIKEQMQKLDKDDKETRPVRNALQVSYDQLSESRKGAFCDVVNAFYGWSWERVERILGVSVLNDLKESSLISEAEDWSKCNQSALKVGFDFDDWMFGDFTCVGRRRAVTMHDLTLIFGEGLHTFSVTTTTTDSRSMRCLLRNLEAPKLRNLILLRDPEAESELEFVEKTESLQTLFLCDIYQNFFSLRKPILIASSYTNVNVGPAPPLRFLRLQDWKSSRLIMQRKLSCEIREIHLYDCKDVEQLPNISLHNLELLSIYGCQNFQSFSPSSVKRWCKLKYLQVAGSDHLTSVPPELGRLENLKLVQFNRCRRLSTFPSLCNTQGLSLLRIQDCPSLQTLPTMSCPLQTLYLANIPIASLNLEETACAHLQEFHLRGCNLESMPSSVWNASSLKVLFVSECRKIKDLLAAIGEALSIQTLTVTKCESLVELPHQVGKLTSLTKLDLSECKSLKGLLSAIGNASSLRTLDLSGCESLVELPDEVGKLMALITLNLSGCKRLKGLPLAIGNASSLQTLDLRGCESLVELPDEVGKLIALTTLDLFECKRLKGLPTTIGNASSLQTLCLRGCESLVELPDGVGKLMALTTLDLSWCKSSKGLSRAIENAYSLQTLSLRGFESLVELPDEVGKLAALKELNLSGCKSLKGLPPAIGNASSLQRLDLSGCESLVELPDIEVGKLAALEELDLSRCKSLNGLTQAIGNASSLITLNLKKCESLVELPNEVGKLTALAKLDLSMCRSLKALPSAIGNASSLVTLNLNNCKSLVELPNEVGQLTTLVELDLSMCRGLKGLPPAIGNASSLQTLDLSGCESLIELPAEVGKLAALTELDLSGCKSLKGLPVAIENASSLQTRRFVSCSSFQIKRCISC